MKNRAFQFVSLLTAICFLTFNCTKEFTSVEAEETPGSAAIQPPAANIIYLPLSLTVYNPCCQENASLIGRMHRVENSNVIHMDTREISGVGLTTGLNYSVLGSSVRNYQFDPNENLATLNWSIRMEREDGCGYNVQFVIHITRDLNGEIIANIHSGNFFCL